MMSIYEIIMLICFGCAWPTSIWKSYVSRNNEGKSIVFLFIVLTGYAAGILNKVFYHYDGVIWLYVTNALMVSIDIILYYRNDFLKRNQKIETGVSDTIYQNIS